MQIPNPYAFYPPRWLDYDIRAGVIFMFAEFSCAADVNRFGARYRLARAFRGMNLEGYSETTARGYNALTGVTLAWSAFEGLLTAINKTAADIPTLGARYNSTDCLADLRQADPSNRFFAFVRDRLDSRRQKAEVQKYIAGHPCCVLTLARGVRHIFAHGPLSPNANQAEPGAVSGVCDRLALMLRRTMDREFTERVEQLVAIFPDTNPAPDDDLPF